VPNYRFSSPPPPSLTKIDSPGNVQWIQNFTSTQPDSIIITIDGGYAYTSVNNSHVTINKLDSNGNNQWNQTCQLIVDGSTLLAQSKDGGYIIAIKNYTGMIYSMPMDGLVLLKTDSFGRTQWVKSYVVPGYAHNYDHLIQTSDGGYAIGGVLRIQDGVLFYHIRVQQY
jgi:hypothetical protein